MAPAIASLCAIPLTLIMLGLSTHVTMPRAKTGISIIEGGGISLAERIRHHGDFILPLAKFNSRR